jgi:hypothetical protein
VSSTISIGALDADDVGELLDEGAPPSLLAGALSAGALPDGTDATTDVAAGVEALSVSSSPPHDAKPATAVAATTRYTPVARRR